LIKNSRPPGFKGDLDKKVLVSGSKAIKIGWPMNFRQFYAVYKDSFINKKQASYPLVQIFYGMIFNLSKQASIGNQFLAELRDVNIQKDRMRFRRNLERIGEILAYELSKHLEHQEIEVETPLGMAQATVPAGRVVVASILRAGLPLHQGVLNYFDRAENAFISAYRKHHKDGTFEINLEYVSCPDLNDCVLILCDPMVATGASIDITLQELRPFGIPKSIHILTAIAATTGLNHIKRLHRNAHIWMGAEDEELTAKSYIVPGLGDAGDLSFGPKLQD
jgi:uracil phosphoribosyltransferase